MLSILAKLPGPHLVIHGGCIGVDTIAGEVAKEEGWEVKVYPADWAQGKKAGPIRNIQMAVEGRPDYALVFLSPESRGTKHMLTVLEDRNISYTLVHV